MSYEAVHNYYEKLVFDEVQRALAQSQASADEGFVEDVACVALNHLPPRYVRHNVDLVFYLSSDERLKMENAVRGAVIDALAFVEGHRRQ